MRYLRKTLTSVKAAFCLLILCWAMNRISVLFSGDPRAPMVDLRLNFNEVGDFPEMGTGEEKQQNLT